MSNQQKLCIYCGKCMTNMAAKYCADPKCGELFSEPGKPEVVDLLYSPPLPPIKKIKFPMPPQLKRESSSSEEDARAKVLANKEDARKKDRVPKSINTSAFGIDPRSSQKENQLVETFLVYPGNCVARLEGHATKIWALNPREKITSLDHFLRAAARDSRAWTDRRNQNIIEDENPKRE